jgi:hypothetical protein
VGRFEEKLRRPDWLGELQGLTVLVGVVAVAASAVRVGTAAGDDGVPVDLQARSLDGVAGVRPEAGGVTVAADSTVEAVVTDPSGQQVLLWTLTWMPTVVLVVAVLTLLFRTLRDARRGDPFTAGTVRRLRVLAVVALVGGEVAAVTESLCGMALVDTVLPDGGGFYGTLLLPVGWVFAGVGFLALGEMVRRGRALREELDGVV